MPNPIDAMPELAVAVGRLCGHWSLSELHAASLFSHLSGMEPHASSIVFNHLKSVRSRKELICDLAETKSEISPHTNADIKSIVGLFEHLSSFRNQIVHNAFGYDTTSDNSVYQIKLAKKPKNYDEIYIKNAVSIEDINSLIECVDSLNTIWATTNRRVAYELAGAYNVSDEDKPTVEDARRNLSQSLSALTKSIRDLLKTTQPLTSPEQPPKRRRSRKPAAS